MVELISRIPTASGKLDKLANASWLPYSITVSQERSQPIITCNRDFFSWTFVSQPYMQGNDSAPNICLGFWGFLNTHLGSKFPNRKKRALKPYMMTRFCQKPSWVSLIHKYRGLYQPVYVSIFGRLLWAPHKKLTQNFVLFGHILDPLNHLNHPNIY